MEGQPVELKLERIIPDNSQRPVPAHKFFWARVGTDILFEVGFFDLVELRTALETARAHKPTEPVKVILAGRFTISPTAALDLLQTTQSLVDDLKSQGMIPVDK